MSALLVLAGCDEVVLKSGETEVVVEAKASSVTRFAAKEMAKFLSKSLGAEVPVVNEPTAGKSGVFIGENKWSREAGIDVSADPRDTYVVKACEGRVYVVGRDDPKFDLVGFMKKKTNGYGTLFDVERSTLFGVYGALEKYVGVRFILPDEELGTIVPKKCSISVPCGTEKVTPSFLLRNPYFGGDGRWYCKDYEGCNVKTLLWLRHRLSSYIIPCCHGSRNFKYIERFGETHPEYLARKKDGSVRLDPKEFAAYQYCWTNPGFREELYQDVKAYLTGQPPSSRGLKSWGPGCKYGEWVDIMPDDSFQGCFCETCQKAYTGKRKSPGDRSCNYASDLMWGVCKEVGERLIKENVKGNITMMAYFPYRSVPDFELPTNVHVMVAQTGPWSMTNKQKLAKEYSEIRAWADKVGHKVWIWTYPHKFGSTMIKGVPCVGPHAWGAYYAGLEDAIIGGFMESECDESIYNFLNYYVFSHVMWDAKTDIDALLDEAYDLLFGAARCDMKKFFTILEDKWTKEMIGRTIDTALGPKTVPPDTKTLWTKVYSPEVRANLDELLRKAAAKVPADSLEAKRIALMRREFYDRILEGAADYEALVKGVESLRFDSRKGPLDISVMRLSRKVTKPANVKTTVSAKIAGDNLEIVFDCVEPEMDKVVCAYNKEGDPECWRNNGVEVLLNPCGDRKSVYHFFLSSDNVRAGEYHVVGSGLPSKWGYEKLFKTETKKTSQGWQGKFIIPLSLMKDMKDAFPVNFCRYRVVGPKSEPIMWSSYAHGFCDVERFGTMIVR